MSSKFAILVDGGFIKKKLKARNKHFPTIDEINQELARIRGHVSLAGFILLRVYYYDAPPASGVLTNPVSGNQITLESHPDYALNLALQQGLEMQPDVALRAGETAIHGWAVGPKALLNIRKNGTRPLVEKDFIPNIEQKGVDLRIGLDIARLSLSKLVEVIVVVTGDSDMIPAFKFARREGVRVYLDHMGHGVKRDLKVHTDLIF
jgi:uncharacterized LabA/DUF88 family protein